MAKQLGRALLVKIDDGAGTLNNLCGFKFKVIYFEQFKHRRHHARLHNA